MDDKRVVRRGYDEMGEIYASERTGNPFEVETLDTLLDLLPEKARVLDAGCGQGTPILDRLQDSTTAIGLDFSRGQLQLATQPAVSLTQGDMTALPFRDATFDAVTAYHSMIHVPSNDHQTVIDEFARVLHPGGRALLTAGTAEWNGANSDWLGSGAEMRWSMSGPENTVEQLESAGFSITNQWTIENECAEEDDATFTAFLALHE
jgi:ubiquinone/menaquinone biosynthesis C-methylase UbiE